MMMFRTWNPKDANSNAEQEKVQSREGTLCKERSFLVYKPGNRAGMFLKLGTVEKEDWK